MARAFSAASTGLVSGTPGRLHGWSFRETSGSATARLRIFDGQGTGGQLVADISLNPAESTRDWLGEQGIEIARGLYVSIDAGAVNGAVWYSASGQPEQPAAYAQGRPGT